MLEKKRPGRGGKAAGALVEAAPPAWLGEEGYARVAFGFYAANGGAIRLRKVTGCRSDVAPGRALRGRCE